MLTKAGGGFFLESHNNKKSWRLTFDIAISCRWKNLTWTVGLDFWVNQEYFHGHTNDEDFLDFSCIWWGNDTGYVSTLGSVPTAESVEVPLSICFSRLTIQGQRIDGTNEFVDDFEEGFIDFSDNWIAENDVMTFLCWSWVWMNSSTYFYWYINQEQHQQINNDGWLVLPHYSDSMDYSDAVACANAVGYDSADGILEIDTILTILWKLKEEYVLWCFQLAIIPTSILMVVKMALWTAWCNQLQCFLVWWVS